MWNKDKSVILTQVIVKACYVLLAALAIAMLWIFLAFDIMNDIGKYIVGPFYAVVPAGYCALICIDKLLNNVKKSIVFDKKNVKLLRIISWCCFYAAFVGALSVVIVYAAAKITCYVYIILVAGEMFMGLILRVIKNCFEQAIALKEENELTI